MSEQENGAVEWYRKYRPSTWKEMIGQEEVVKTLQAKVKAKQVPRAIFLSGPSGTGKTTIARRLKAALGCNDLDFDEVNCPALESPIQKARDIEQKVGLAPIGSCRIWYLDEVQSLTRARYAQEALLKTLEDIPSWVYFILASTDPNKVITAIRTRCTMFNLAPLGQENLITLARSVLEKERVEMSDDVLEKLAEVANGSARKMLVDMQRVASLPSDGERLEAIRSSDSECQAIQICRLLINDRTSWKEVAALLKEVTDEPESIRRMMLEYSVKVLLGGGKAAQRANKIIQRFESAFYDGGRASLASACWDIVDNG